MSDNGARDDASQNASWFVIFATAVIIVVLIVPIAFVQIAPDSYFVRSYLSKRNIVLLLVFSFAGVFLLANLIDRFDRRAKNPSNDEEIGVDTENDSE